MKRNIYLDYLRGLSAIAVMLYHYTTRYDQLFGHTTDYPVFFQYGSYGVLVFFLLSGYLTFGRIEKYKPESFIVKRFKKLYPSYWIAMIVTAVATYFMLPELSVSLKDFFLNFSMIQMYLGAKNVDGAYWTLSCELFFYFFIYLICLSKVKCIKAILIWFVFQIVLLLLPPPVVQNGMVILLKKFNDLLYFHCFMVGGLISIIEQKMMCKPNNSRRLFEIAGLIVLCLFFISQQFISHEFSSGIFFIISTLLLSMSVLLYDKRILLPSFLYKLLMPIAWFAVLSYPFYLLHQNLGYIIIKSMESFGLVNELYLIIPFTIILLLAYALYKIVEEPIVSNSIKKRI